MDNPKQENPETTESAIPAAEPTQPVQPATPEPLLDASETALPQIQAFGATHKSRKKLIIITAVAGMLLATSGAFTTYYFAIRVQDNEYGKAAILVDSIIANIDHVQSKTGFGVFKPSRVVTASVTTVDENSSTIDNKTLQNVEEVKNSIKNMTENMTLLKKSPAIQRDSVTQNALATTQSSIDRYQAALMDAANSVGTIADIYVKCNDFSEKLDTVKSLDEYDDISTSCSVALTSSKSIPLTDLDKVFYQPWRAAFLDLLASTRNGIVAYTTHDAKKYQKALQSAQNDGKVFEELKDDLKDFHYNPPADPTKGLKDLKVALHNRQTVFFR